MSGASQMPMVEVRGDGLAACACAALLRRKGFPVFVDRDTVNRDRRAALPAILVNQATQSLLSDIFADRDLFEGLRRINRRIVAWGHGAPVVIPHSAVVLSEQALLDALWNRVDAGASTGGDAPAWIVAGSRGHRISTEEKTFGSREAIATPVELTPAAERDAFWIESVPSGWLFLLPVGLYPAEESRAMLIAVGNEPQRLLEESCVIRKAIVGELGGEEGSARRVVCSPRIGGTLAGPGWLACGTAAMSFDPISGEGAGHAAREAILAAAAIGGVTRGLPAERLVSHYTARLMAGFERHLEICLKFYEQARSGAWWDREIELLREGIAWCRANMDAQALREFQLVDFDFEPRGTR